MCACLEADVDFSDGEIQVFDTSLDFPIREIQTAATNMDFCNGEICILGDCLEFPNGYIQTGAKKKDFPIGEIHICMQIYTYLGYPNMCMCTSRYGFLQGEIQVFETSLDSLLEKSKLLQQNWISTMEKSIYVSHICKYLDYPSMNFWIYMNCHLKDSHFCRSTCTLPHYHFTICAKVEATGITRDRGISEAGWRVH